MGVIKGLLADPMPMPRGAGGMLNALHMIATTTPGIRQRISGSDEPAAVLVLR